MFKAQVTHRSHGASLRDVWTLQSATGRHTVESIRAALAACPSIVAVGRVWKVA